MELKQKLHPNWYFVIQCGPKVYDSNVTIILRIIKICNAIYESDRFMKFYIRPNGNRI